MKNLNLPGYSQHYCSENRMLRHSVSQRFYYLATGPILSLALDKIKVAGILVEDAVLAFVDAVMSVTVDML
jgi:hypothetical protein